MKQQKNHETKKDPKDTKADNKNVDPKVEFKTGVNAGVPQQPRKPRSDKGKARGSKLKVTGEDFKIPLAAIMHNFTKAIASQVNNPAIIMSEEESKEIDKGINIWCKYRADFISGIYPEVCLITPILAYGMRVFTVMRMQKHPEKKKEELFVPSPIVEPVIPKVPIKKADPRYPPNIHKEADATARL